MKNVINYYYNFNIINVYNFNNSIYFNYKNKDYFFMILERPINEVQSIYNLNIELKKRNILTNTIVLNKENQIITFVNNIPYILIREDVKNKRIDINDILYIQNNTINMINEKKLYRNNWIIMWKSKIDYYEEQMNNNENKFKLLYNSIDYYIGLGENAICYLINNKISNNNLCLSHKRVNINMNTFDFYNPVNYVIDNRVRDISEYIKNMFFYNDLNIDIVFYYLNYVNFTRDEYILLISRLLFPTYYFDLYDLILLGDIKEDIIKPIIDKTDSYIDFIKRIIIFIIYQKGINIPYIEWIIKDAN